jgi:2-iminoacetate synthase ThiH
LDYQRPYYPIRARQIGIQVSWNRHRWRCSWSGRALRIAGHGTRVSFSPKVFIPLTRLCRDVCGYCTFAKTPREMEKPFLSPDDVLKIARDGVKAGCSEALFTLGELPELRYAAARAPQLLRPARATWTFA